MPGSRKILLRSFGASSAVQRPTGLKESGSSSESRDNVVQAVEPPKHVPLPDIPQDSAMVFEIMLFVYSIVAMGLQYINMYKTVWWLPDSNVNYAVNFYLIDPFLVTFLVLLMSRRIIWCFLVNVYGPDTVYKGCMFWLMQSVKLIVVTFIGFVFLGITYLVVIKYSFIHTLYICYPLFTYLVLFGPSLRLLVDRILLLSDDKMTDPSYRSSPQADPKTDSKGLLLHNCSSSPERIRDEVEVFKTDFNGRVKTVLFNSMLSAYYMAFIPVCFAQNALYYNAWWVTQHVCLVWISSFILFMLHYFPPRYIDMLHRTALHLGKWQKAEGRHAHHVPYNAWSELQVWQKGTVVKHVRGLFKAEGYNNTAEPGNSTHSRFHFMFYDPLRIVTLLLEVTVAIVTYQFVVLVLSTEWSHVLSQAIMLFCNYYSLFKLLRDRLILGRVYKPEKTAIHGEHE